MSPHAPCPPKQLLPLALAFTAGVLAGENGKKRVARTNYEYTSLISRADEYCYSRFVEDDSCCVDQVLFGGVRNRTVRLRGTEWHCGEDDCYDQRKGRRGDGLMWIPEGADCSTPRILYVHGGSWEYGSPFTEGYPQLCSRISNFTASVVYALDYPLAPVGNFSAILDATLAAMDWLAHNGPHGECPLPVPPLYIGGDSSGGGTALSALMKLMQEPKLGPYKGNVLLSGAFVFSPWTNLKCNTPDYYHHAFAEIVDEDRTKHAFVGDLMFRGQPLNNKGDFTGNAQDYVGDDPKLLTDPVASPLYAEMEHWRNVPPLYIAVGGSESIMGDSVLFAQKASHKRVEVQLDVYEGMWHVFPMYSEGCGGQVPLWQATSALTRMAKFVRSIAYDGAPSCSTQPGLKGASPFTVFHYNDPHSDSEWFPDDASCAALEATVHTAGGREPALQHFGLPPELWVFAALAAALLALLAQNIWLRRRLKEQMQQSLPLG